VRAILTGMAFFVVTAR